MDRKEARVYKDRTGYWVAVDNKTNQKIGGLQDTELDAYKIANWNGYVVQ